MEERLAVRVCVGCEKEFEDKSRTAPRSFCYVCRPVKAAAQPVARVSVKGKPFTVPHFRAWSAKFKLKDGSRFDLDGYQALFLEDLFARDEAGLPVFSELWLVVPEGNGKTTFFSLLVLYTIEFVPEAWVPVAASARDQAVDLTYRIASGFVQRNKLETRFRLHPGYRQIVHQQQLGAAKIFASDAASGDGVDPTLAIIEELHRLPSMDLYETWSGKLDKSNGQLIVASTAGEPGGAFEELRETIRQLAGDVTRDRCFLRAAGEGVVLHEYAIPATGDPEDLELVAAANPFRGKTVEQLRKKRAKPSWNLAHWLRFTCNLPTRSVHAAITEAEWEDARTTEAIPLGEPIWLGLDLGWKVDTTAMVPFWPRDNEFRLFGPATILEPPGNGNQLDAHLVEAALLDVHSRNPIHTVVMDMTEGAQLSQWIEEHIGAEVVDRSQSTPLQVLDYKRFMEALRYGWLKHSGDPGLTKHALNAGAQVLPGGDTRFVRIKASRTVSVAEQRRRAIDGLVAAAMVHTSACAEDAAGDLQPFVFA